MVCVPRYYSEDSEDSEVELKKDEGEGGSIRFRSR